MTDNTAANPVTVNGALSQEDREEWKAEIDSELDSLRHHGTWEIVEEPGGVKPLTTRFVFLRKHDEHGNVCRHNARLVVRGFLQGDVEQTFAPFVDFTTVRTCLSVAVQRKYATHQMDVQTAFLHGQIDTDVYIKAPDGVRLCEDVQVLKLRRGLYGVKQAPRLLQDKWKEVMSTMSFSALRSDECVYRRENVWLLLYVDDIIAMGPVEGEVVAVKKELSRHLDVKDLGALTSFIGVVFTGSSGGAWLAQRHYIAKVLQRFGMSTCKSVSTPMCESALKEFSDLSSDPVNRLQ